ncbi:MAG: hypothetical protein APR54_03080 [Candidatus Cloacimonas sp. SDB]|nr:MAG: hypothetical protein APR54_03080 [Candidatus Cloacimonas sp. SDB]
MIKNDLISYFVNDDYSFTVYRDKKSRVVGKLIDQNTGKQVGKDLYQRVFPGNVENLVNVAKVIISAAWQDGKILPAERKAFDLAFSDIEFTAEQKQKIEKEFTQPTPLNELLDCIKTREEKLIILETSLLLILADNEFHPQEKKFIETLVKEFQLESEDIALLYYILPEEVKKYIVKERIHETLEIDDAEIAALQKFSNHKEPVANLNHEKVYVHFVNSWKNRSTRYKRESVY